MLYAATLHHALCLLNQRVASTFSLTLEMIHGLIGVDGAGGALSPSVVEEGLGGAMSLAVAEEDCMILTYD